MCEVLERIHKDFPNLVAVYSFYFGVRKDTKRGKTYSLFINNKKPFLVKKKIEWEIENLHGGE